VPTVSRFYGIVIQMFYKEHGVPHFHARYGGRIAVFEIEALSRIRGNLPSRAERLVREWAELHQEDLLQTGSEREPGILLRQSNLSYERDSRHRQR
jgi:hypothetical protein